MRLEGARVIVVIDEQFEDLELWYPIYRLKEEGAIIHLLGEHSGIEYKGKYGVPATSDDSYLNASPSDYHALLIPGGWAPDKLRRQEAVLNLVRKMNDEGKAIGTICHGGHVLISAGILKGRTITGTSAIRDDIVNCGAEWSHEGAVVDGNIVSAQRPPDLPAYMRLFIEVLEKQLKKEAEQV